MLGSGEPEDSAHAIFLLLIASHGRVSDLADFTPWYKQRVRLSETSGKAFNPYAIEFFSAAVLNRLGIRTAPARICSKDEACSLGPEFIVKITELADAATSYCASYSGAPEMIDAIDHAGAMALGVNVRVLKFARRECLARRLERAGRWVLVVEIIRDAASLDFVSRKLLPESNAKNQIEAVMRDCGLGFAKCKSLVSESLAEIIGKSCPPADELFADFHPSPEQLCRIESVICVTGEAYLKILAARVLLGISCAHFGNVLATKTGELVSIDHVSGRLENGDDLRMLLKFVAHDSLVFRILCEIAETLSEEDIRAAVAAIPDYPACGSNAGISEYFAKRLRLFQNLCASWQREAVPLTVGTS